MLTFKKSTSVKKGKEYIIVLKDEMWLTCISSLTSSSVSSIPCFVLRNCLNLSCVITCEVTDCVPELLVCTLAAAMAFVTLRVESGTNGGKEFLVRLMTREKNIGILLDVHSQQNHPSQCPVTNFTILFVLSPSKVGFWQKKRHAHPTPQNIIMIVDC